MNVIKYLDGVRDLQSRISKDHPDKYVLFILLAPFDRVDDK